ncbi:hypothetical protein pdam_00015342 [Pocillopora damicornis]|uniref:Uncharacterized protein n=1 Tax=Pocillopora damicornis TaxID=46731 RepID=A0A3M6V1J7_POCDA|nr:hypothetical protein pdam_00015342 [Pocillopora damicornis]
MGFAHVTMWMKVLLESSAIVITKFAKTGSFHCPFLEGFENIKIAGFLGDGRLCHDVDECENGTHSLFGGLACVAY